MKCPFCAEDNTKVIDSRPADDNSSIRRRRQCERCGKRFTTYEKLETLPLMIIKKDDSREPYNRAKIENGILLSSKKIWHASLITEIRSSREFSVPVRSLPSRSTRSIRQWIRLRLRFLISEKKRCPVNTSAKLSWNV